MRAFAESDNPPVAGSVDTFIRAMPAVAHLAAGVLMYGAAIIALGLAAVPGLLLVSAVGPAVLRTESWWAWPALGLLLSTALFASGFALLVVVPVLNAVLPTRVRPSTGGYFTVASLPWYLHNGLFYLVRYTMLPFVTMTPIGTLFLRAMGMRIGRRVRVTTEYLSDVRLITLGDDVTIGGSATLFCHHGGAGKLVIAPIMVGRGAVIGEKATVMGGVTVGEGATVLAHAVLLPGTRVGARERWGGAPARRIGHDEWVAIKREIDLAT